MLGSLSQIGTNIDGVQLADNKPLVNLDDDTEYKVHEVERVPETARNGAIEQVSRIFGRHPDLLGTSRPSPVQHVEPRNVFEQSIFIGPRAFRRRGLPPRHP
jgi:hypothetical protein